MKKYMKSLLVGFFCLISAISTFGQQGAVKITGTFTQKKNYEITIAGKTNEGSFRAAQYFVDTTTNNFSIVFPFRTGATYEMRVAVMKKGNRRLEVDLVASFPLKAAASQRLHVTLNPALFKQPGKGLTIGKLPAKTAGVSVSGWLKGIPMGMDLSIGKVVEGQLKTIQTYCIAKGDSSFSFSVPVEKAGFYYLSTVRIKKRLYLKPNDQINLVLDPKSGNELSASKSTVENQLIAQWEQLKAPLMSFVAMGAKPDREAFSAVYKDLQPKIGAFMKQVNTTDTKFNSLFKSAIQLDNNLLALNVLLKSSLEKRGAFMMPSRDFLNVPDYYRSFLKENRLKSANILQLAEANDYVNLYAKFSLCSLDEVERRQMDDAHRVKLMMNSITNDTLKSFVLKSQLEELELSVSNYSEFGETFMPYQKYAKLPSVKQKYDLLLKQFVADTAFIGKSAYDFTLPDVNGKMVSMKDFAGKVVLIDVWATWCGPCKAQMPFLKEVEASYKGNDNVVFVGISLDAEKDKQKWLNMIKEKELEGIQLLDDVGKSFGRKYKAVSIPRFFLIDKKGNWAEVRCPLPENKDKLKKYIDRELNKSI
ncbi:TlpA family protein disulfide reductase [Pedobacter nyackensis]|uniref:TlpA family protein disulfide reductase n=1 Tax=Pedobacter nyackensis TaxID=475255 RepID=UPI00292ED2C1|nr:redoxin domain-containing protein [Pedobacter nyackensis]